MHSQELVQAYDDIVRLALDCCRSFKHTLEGGLQLQVGCVSVWACVRGGVCACP